MLLFRSLSVGLLGAVLFLVASPPDGPIAAAPTECATAETTARPDVTIVDVAHGADAATIASLVRVDRAESIVSVDGRAVDGNIAAGAAIATHARGARRYIDVEVATPRERRRVLVLLH